MVYYFDDRFYNPVYFNAQYYQQVRGTIPSDQSERVMKAIKAFMDMMDAVDGMDQIHQNQTLLLCLNEMAARRQWK